MDTNTVSLFVSLASLISSVAALGMALFIFQESSRDMRIETFVTRYIVMAKENEGRVSDRDFLGIDTILKAGILWLKTDEEARIAIGRIDDCGVHHPFERERYGNLLEFCRFIFDNYPFPITSEKYFTIRQAAAARGIYLQPKG